MGAVLEDKYGVADLHGREYWEASLKNKKIILRQVEEAILALSTHFGESKGVQSYTIDTGQDKQIVTRAELGSLYATQRELTNQIAMLEMQLNNSAPRRIAPRY